MTDQTPTAAPVTAQDTPGGPGRPTGGPETPQTAVERLQRLRGQLAVEHAKAVAADQAAVQRPGRAALRVNPHSGTAAGLEIAIFLADHHLREAGEEAGEQPVGNVEQQRDQLAAALTEVLGRLHPFTRLGDPTPIGWQTVNPISPASYDRWQAALDGKEQP